MSKTKKYLIDGKKKMDAKDFKGALGDLDVALMLDQKNFQALLMVGLCHEKLEDYEKAKENYLYAYDIKNDDPIVNNKLYQVHCQLEDYDSASEYIENIVKNLAQKPDKVKQYEEYLMKLVEVYAKGEDQEKLYNTLQSILPRQDVSQDIKIQVTRSYYNLAISYSSLHPNHHSILSDNFRDIADSGIVDEILTSVFNYMGIKATIQDKVDIIFKDFCHLNTSAIALENQLEYYGYYATKNIKIMETIVQKALDFLGHQYITDKSFQSKLKTSYFKEQNYDNNEESKNIKERLIPKCQIFLYVYHMMLQSDNSDQGNIEMTTILIERLGMDKIEFPNFDDNQDKINAFSKYIWGVIYQIWNSIQEHDFQLANKNLGKFLSTINSQTEFADIRFFEDLHTKLGLQVFDDLDSLLQVKVICKIRLHGEFSNLSMLKCYYDCMVKLVRNFQHYDPEVPMDQVIQEILKLEPENKFFQAELIWLNFSNQSVEEQKENFSNTIAQLKKILDLCNGQNMVKAKILKRIGTLKFIFNDYIELSEIISFYEKSQESNPKDYQIHACLGLLYKIQNKEEKALEEFQFAFVNYSYDIQINKCLFYQLNNLNQVEEAIDFVERIEPGFQKIFWVNYVLALSNMNRQNFEKAEKFISNSIQLFQSDARRNLQNYYEKNLVLEGEEYGIPHFLDQNNIKFLDDYPIFSDQYWTNNAIVLENSYPKINTDEKLYKMYIQQSQILRMEGMIGSALSSIKEALEVLFNAHYSENKGNEIYNYIYTPSHPLSSRMLETLQTFEKAFIKSSSLNLAEFDIENFEKDAILLQLEYAQVLFYTQDYFHSCKRIQYALVLAIYLIEKHIKDTQNEDNQEGEDEEENNTNIQQQQDEYCQQIEDLYNRTLALIYEIGNSQVTKTWQRQNVAQGLAIYKQYEGIEVPQCDNIMDFAVLAEFYLLGFMMNNDRDKIIYCLGHLESGLKCMGIDMNSIKLQNKEILKEINNKLNDMSQKHINAVVALLADLIFANFKLYEISKEEERFENAVEISKIGMILFSDSCVFFNYYGLLTEDSGKKIGAFIKSIQIDGQNSVAIDNMAEIFFQNGYYQESIQLYLKSMELRTGNVKACVGVIAITLIQAIDYVRVFNDKFENSMKQFTYFKIIQDFFIEKCRSYLEFVQEFESNETTMLFTSVLEALEYNNYQNIKFSQVQQPSQLGYEGGKNQDFLLNMLNLQLMGNANTQVKNIDLKKVYENKIQGFLNFSEKDQEIIKLQIENTLKDTGIYEKLYQIMLLKLKEQNENLVKKLNSGSKISSLKEDSDQQQQEQSDSSHHYVITELFNHMKNMEQLFVLGLLSKQKDTHVEFKKLCKGISDSQCDILIKNAQRFCDLYQAQVDLAQWDYLYLCQLHEQDIKEINEEVKQSIIVLSNARQQIYSQPAWVFFQLEEEIDNLDIINMGDMYYLEGLHAHKSQNQKMVKRKLFGSILNDPSSVENRDALNAYTVTIERKCVGLDILRFTTSNQYEKRILNYVNSDDVTLEQKISQLGKGCMYLNKPHLWYLYVHYSFEDQTRYSKQFFYYMYQILSTNVIDKLVKGDELHNGIKKRAVKLLSEIYWRYKINYPEEEEEKFDKIRKYLERNQQCVKDFSQFESNMLIFLNKNGADISALEKLISEKQDFSEICRKTFMTKKGKDLIDLLQQLKEQIINFEDQLTSRTQFKKLYNMVQYVDSFIYLTAIAELFDGNSEIEEVDLLEIVQNASENCQGYSNQSVNMIFLYLQYCYQNSMIDEMDKYLEMFGKFSNIISRKDNLISGYFDLILKFHYIIDIQEDEIKESIEEFEQYIQYIRDDYYMELNSSVKSLFHYLQGLVRLKSAELNPVEDKQSLMKDFKLAILYRPDFGTQIIKNFV